MNALVPVSQSGGSFALVPQNLGEAMELARMMSANDILPAAFKGKPAHCLMVIELAGRWRMSPFQVAMGCSIIQGKLMIEGKTIAAAVNTQPGMKSRLNYAYTGTGDNRTVTVSGHLQGETEPRTVEVRLGDAKTANGIWVKQADQQLAYHGARVWGRRHTPEIVLGVYAPEEFEPTTIETHADVAQRPRIAHQPLTAGEYLGDTIPALEEPAQPPSPLATLKERLPKCETADDVRRLGERWQGAVTKAEAAGKPFPALLLETATDMLADRLGELSSTSVTHEDDLAGSLA